MGRLLQRTWGRAWRQALPACAVVASLAIPSAGLARPAADELLITYVGSSSLRLAVNGNSVPSGGTIPAGSYNVLVDDPDYTNPRFVMSGPGVSINSDLNSTGMGIDRPATFGPFSLSGSYTARDANMGASLSFSASGSSSGGSSGGSASGTSGGSTGGSTSGGTTKTKTLGTLTGSISAAGKAVLSFGGRPVKSLKAGVYTLTVADHSTKAALVVQRLGYPAMNESGVATVGSKTGKLNLIAGRWFFRAAPAGPKTYFTVTS